MSSPIRKMLSSRSISSRSASRSAARNSFSGIAVHLPLARVQVPVQLVHRRVGALLGEADGLVDLRLDAVLQLPQLLGAGDAGLLELLLEVHHGVALAPAPLLLLGAVLVRIDDRVALEPVVDRLDEPGLRVRPNLLH